MIVILTFKYKDVPLAEVEVAERIKAALHNLDKEVIIAGPDHKNILTGESIESLQAKIEFVISLHVTIPPIPKVVNYLCIWDPFYWRLNYQDLMSILSYDDFLLVESSSLTNTMQRFLRLLNVIEDLNFNYLSPSVSIKKCITPVFKKTRKLFYCGIGADQVGFCKSRLNDILKYIDNPLLLDLYGPEKIKNPNGSWVSPWKGYYSYRGEVPFDGYSVLQQMHNAGISLVVSSPYHRQEGVASARIFEACASGNVIIADENTYFNSWKDAIYQVNFNRPSAEVAQEIIACYEHINANPHIAEEMAYKSQIFFAENYSLEVYLQKIIKEHSSRENFRENFHDVKSKINHKSVVRKYLKQERKSIIIEELRYFVKKYDITVLKKLYRNLRRILGYV